MHNQGMQVTMLGNDYPYAFGPVGNDYPYKYGVGQDFGPQPAGTGYVGPYAPEVYEQMAREVEEESRKGGMSSQQITDTLLRAAELGLEVYNSVKGNVKRNNPGSDEFVDDTDKEIKARFGFEDMAPWLIGGGILIGGLILVSMTKRRRRR